VEREVGVVGAGGLYLERRIMKKGHGKMVEAAFPQSGLMLDNLGRESDLEVSRYALVEEEHDQGLQGFNGVWYLAEL
jgi:hypothetical protein